MEREWLTMMWPCGATANKDAGDVFTLQGFTGCDRPLRGGVL